MATKAIIFLPATGTEIVNMINVFGASKVKISSKRRQLNGQDCFELVDIEDTDISTIEEKQEAEEATHDEHREEEKEVVNLD